MDSDEAQFFSPGGTTVNSQGRKPLATVAELRCKPWNGDRPSKTGNCRRESLYFLSNPSKATICFHAS